MSTKTAPPVYPCVWCGSTKTYIDETASYAHCPVCSKRVDLMRRDAVPAMTRNTMRQLGEARFGTATETAFRRQPRTSAERRFRSVWNRAEYAETLPMLLANKAGFPNGEMTERDSALAGILMQWLGSPVGQNFLHECGFVAAEENK